MLPYPVVLFAWVVPAFYYPSVDLQVLQEMVDAAFPLDFVGEQELEVYSVVVPEVFLAWEDDPFPALVPYLAWVVPLEHSWVVA